MSARLVYLDQNQVSALTTDGAAPVRDLLVGAVRAGDAVVPCSLVHLAETLKDADQGRRQAKFKLLGSLSGGYVLADPARAIAAERAAPDRNGRVTYVRSRLVRRLPCFAALVAGLRVAVGIVPAKRVVAAFDPILDRTAGELNEQGQNRPSMRQALALARNVPVEQIDEARDADRFRSVALRHAVQDCVLAHPKRALSRNDLVDLTCLAVAVPYFDVVVTDHDMHDLLHMATRDRPHLRRARVLRRIADLPAALASSTSR